MDIGFLALPARYAISDRHFRNSPITVTAIPSVNSSNHTAGGHRSAAQFEMCSVLNGSVFFQHLKYRIGSPAIDPNVT